MSNRPDTQVKFEYLISEICETLEYIQKRSREFSLMDPNPPNLFEVWITVLNEKRVTLTVVGRAKRGKSSFINSLIGRELLPVDLDIATSQAIVVRKASEESYRANLVDGTSLLIRLEDLYLLGSEVNQDSGDEESLANKIQWIDVNVPSEFLPENHEIIDTPGLSSLYSRHSAITFSFLHSSDIIIFVLDSERPILQEEINFLHFLLNNEYRNIFFIQTKIDDGGWEEINARNEEKLQQEFEKKLFSHKVWPISNTSLLLGRKTKNAKIIERSLFDSLNAHLEDFIFYRTTWQRMADALKDAYKFYISRRSILEEKLESMERPAKGNPTVQQAKNDKDTFYRDWVFPGTELKKVKADILQTIEHDKSYFRDVIKLGGILENQFNDKIDEARSIDELITISQTLGDEVRGAALVYWETISRSSRKKCLEILQNADEILQHAVLPSKEVSYKGLELANKQLNDNREIEKTIRLSGVAAGLGAVSYLFTLGNRETNLNKVVRTLLQATKLGVGIAAIATHLKARRELNLKNAINECNGNLRKLVNEVRNFFEDRQPDKDSITNTYFSDLQKNTNLEIDRLVSERKLFLDERHSTLVEDLNVSNASKIKAMQKIQSQLNQWDSLGEKIQSLQDSVEEIRKNITKGE